MTKASRTNKTFDCVKFMREARARITAETADMNIEERIEWFNSKQYADPELEELAARIRKSTQAKPTDIRDDWAKRETVTTNAKVLKAWI